MPRSRLIVKAALIWLSLFGPCTANPFPHGGVERRVNDDFVFRMDTRSPQELARDGGFRPHGSNWVNNPRAYYVERHYEGGPRGVKWAGDPESKDAVWESAFVSVAKRDLIKDYEKGGWVYEIVPFKNFIDAGLTQGEILAFGGVKWSQVRRFRWGPDPREEWILNPDFDESCLTSPLRGITPEPPHGMTYVQGSKDEQTGLDEWDSTDAQVEAEDFMEKLGIKFPPVFSPSKSANTLPGPGARVLADSEPSTTSSDSEEEMRSDSDKSDEESSSDDWFSEMMGGYKDKPAPKESLPNQVKEPIGAKPASKKLLTHGELSKEEPNSMDSFTSRPGSVDQAVPGGIHEDGNSRSSTSGGSSHAAEQAGRKPLDTIHKQDSLPSSDDSRKSTDEEQRQVKMHGESSSSSNKRPIEETSNLKDSASAVKLPKLFVEQAQKGGSSGPKDQKEASPPVKNEAMADKGAPGPSICKRDGTLCSVRQSDEMAREEFDKLAQQHGLTDEAFLKVASPGVTKGEYLTKLHQDLEILKMKESFADIAPATAPEDLKLAMPMTKNLDPYFKTGPEFETKLAKLRAKPEKAAGTAIALVMFPYWIFNAAVALSTTQTPLERVSAFTSIVPLVGCVSRSLADWERKNNQWDRNNPKHTASLTQEVFSVTTTECVTRDIAFFIPVVGLFVGLATAIQMVYDNLRVALTVKNPDFPAELVSELRFKGWAEICKNVSTGFTPEYIANLTNTYRSRSARLVYWKSQMTGELKHKTQTALQNSTDDEVKDLIRRENERGLNYLDDELCSGLSRLRDNIRGEAMMQLSRKLHLMALDYDEKLHDEWKPQFKNTPWSSNQNPMLLKLRSERDEHPLSNATASRELFATLDKLFDKKLGSVSEPVPSCRKVHQPAKYIKDPECTNPCGKYNNRDISWGETLEGQDVFGCVVYVNGRRTDARPPSCCMYKNSESRAIGLRLSEEPWKYPLGTRCFERGAMLKEDKFIYM
ncbi:hypothetical protein CDD80_2141 [Ophiocordyceps camponoti-rufipedis]|uniref:Enterotoxin n=1 Tax=Ophiocordyceps camponoti-rufipedis TaxID=2004952 RepID=A0A2C5ZKH2_9HYPO|nr:hypothetical protein CDD80_2141 [Ophiocordyceps camponoti-rufipedis]